MEPPADQDPKPLLGYHPNIPMPNPNLSRDELGLIMAYHRKNVEQLVHMAPIETCKNIVPNHIALKALENRVLIVACNEPGCEKFDAHIRKYYPYNLQYDKYGCDCCGFGGIFEPSDLLCHTCQMCKKRFCKFHLANLDIPPVGHVINREYGYKGYTICERCLNDMGCPQCHRRGEDPNFTCDGYMDLLLGPRLYHPIYHDYYECTGLAEELNYTPTDGESCYANTGVEPEATQTPVLPGVDECSDVDDPHELLMHEAAEATLPY